MILPIIFSLNTTEALLKPGVEIWFKYLIQSLPITSLAVFGVLTGMPQYVWSNHHAYHHRTNGAWEKYKGPLSTISTDEYDVYNDTQKKRYWMFRHPSFLLLGGFVYVLFNPRVNWVKGNLVVFKNIMGSLFNSKIKTSEVIEKWESRYWKTPREYRHQTYNNVTLLTLWFFACQWMGAGSFFLFYALSLSLSGGLGILFFTLQHNFEDSYAADTETVDYYRAALEGTSCMVFPKWINWCSADIAYHHIHHLNSVIPNYRLAKCHRDLEDLFPMVTRIKLSEILASTKFLLWNKEKQIIVTK